MRPAPSPVPSPFPSPDRRAAPSAVPTDAELQAAVTSELLWVKDVDATHIGVTAVDGAVTLEGQVGSFPEKRLAVRAAQRVGGVTTVSDELTVRAAPGAGTDTDIGRVAGEALATAVNVPPTVRATVQDHVVTLRGVVTWQYQRVAAGRAVHYLAGVRNVSNLVTISPGVATAGIGDEIMEALARNAQVDGRTVAVTVDTGGTITLTGTVGSWEERRQAEQVCWSAPGVVGVLDHLRVERAPQPPISPSPRPRVLVPPRATPARDDRPLPPGAANAVELEVLSREECLQLLRGVSTGWLVHSTALRPRMAMVNVALHGDDVLVRTGPGDAALAADNEVVMTIGVSSTDEATRTGWSVTVTGTAHLLAADEERTGTVRTPWAPGTRPHVLAIPTEDVTGRRITTGPARGTGEASCGWWG